MLKTLLLSALMLAGGLALVPSASAECVPALDPDFCEGPVEEILERLPDGLPRCWYYPETGDIYCEWEA